MKSWYWGATVSILALSLTSCNNVKTPADIDKQAGESVVLVSYEDRPGQGTGFFVKGDGNSACTVLTARHVIPPNGKLQLQTSDQKTWKGSQITSLKRFPKQDLALVTFKPEGQSCPYKAFTVGNSDKVTVGENIYITGFPGNSLGRQFVEGKVSLIASRTEGYGISYTAITAGGMSGGPVLNTNGEVIAVHGRTEVELAQLAEIKGEQPPPQQQSTRGVNSQIGDAVGTFKWGVPINTYLDNVAKISTEETVTNSDAGNTGTKWTPKTAGQWLALGLDLSASKRYEEALAAYEKAIELQPENAITWIGIGNARYSLKRYEDALIAYDTAISLNPEKINHALALANIGSTLEKLQRYEESLASYNKAIDLNPNSAFAWHSKGFALRKLQRYEEAIEAYDKSISINPDDALVWSNRGSSLWYLQRYEDALESFDKAILLNPKNSVNWFSRGATLEKLGRYSDAITSYEKAIEVNSDWSDKTPADAWRAKGNALIKLERYEEALLSYNTAIKLNSNYADAWNGRGSSLHSLERYQEALTAYEKTIDIQPNHYYAWNNKGWLLKDLKRYEEALQAYDKAISINPEQELALNNRKKLLKQLGRSN